MTEETQPDLVRLPVNRKGKDGRVTIWNLELKNEDGEVIQKAGYVKVYSVNAREAIAFGSALHRAPSEKDAQAAENDEADEKERSEKADEKAAKLSAKDLQITIDENDLDVDLSQFEKIGEKRAAVSEALIEKEIEENK